MEEEDPVGRGVSESLEKRNRRVGSYKNYGPNIDVS
jgi:hypothetical protein